MLQRFSSLHEERLGFKMSDTQEDKLRSYQEAVVARGLEVICGDLTQLFDQELIEKFCGHCDPAARQRCRPNDQGRYVDRNWCGWSSRNGGRLTEVTLDTLKFGGKEYGSFNNLTHHPSR